MNTDQFSAVCIFKHLSVRKNLTKFFVNIGDKVFVNIDDIISVYSNFESTESLS